MYGAFNNRSDKIQFAHNDEFAANGDKVADLQFYLLLTAIFMLSVIAREVCW
jgi:hypothetical protein